MIPTVKTWRCTVKLCRGETLRFHTDAPTKLFAMWKARDELNKRGIFNGYTIKIGLYQFRWRVSTSYFRIGRNVYAMKKTEIGTIVADRSGRKAKKLVDDYIGLNLEKLAERDDAVFYGYYEDDARGKGTNVLYEPWTCERLPCDYGEKI